jgi:hypothetical protein
MTFPPYIYNFFIFFFFIFFKVYRINYMIFVSVDADGFDVDKEVIC